MFKRLSATAASLALVGAALPALAQEVEPTPRRILLSTGGVGLFEYVAQVTDTETLVLPTRLDQVNDLLKSLTIHDPKGQSVSVRLAARDSLAELFRDSPFPPEALTSPQALIDSLQGEEVNVSGPRAMTGRVLSVVPETEISPKGEVIREQHRVSLMTDKGLRQFILEEADSIAPTDPELREDLTQALEILADHRRDDSRAVEITLSGQGAREVTLAHVAQVPLWKATYRLTLPQAQGAGAGTGAAPSDSRLTGWAVLENLSGMDWKDVELGVISGSAATFAQDLHSPYWVPRETVPVTVPGRVLPPADGGTVPSLDMAQRKTNAPAMPMRALAAPAPMAESMEMVGAAPGDSAMASVGGILAAPPLGTAGATQVAAQVVFTLPQPVTLETGQTLLIPLTDTALPVTRVAHFSPASPGNHPWAAARLRNTGSTALPPGAVSVTQDTPEGLAYLGDTRLTTLPPDEDRLLSFALDQDITITRDRSEDRVLSGLTAAKGVISLRQLARSETAYAIRNDGAEDREVVLDHPQRPGWVLSPPPDFATLTQTPDAHRLSFTVPAGETVMLTLTQERPLEERYGAGDLSESLLASLSTTGALGEAEKQAARQMAQLTARAGEYDRRARDLDREMAEVDADQARLRENLGSVPEDSDLHGRFLDRMGQLEDRLMALRDQREETRAEAQKARAALADYIAGLTLPGLTPQ